MGLRRTGRRAVQPLSCTPAIFFFWGRGALENLFFEAYSLWSPEGHRAGRGPLRHALIPGAPLLGQHSTNQSRVQADRGLAPIRWVVVGLALGAAQSGELPVVLQGGDWVDELASSPFPSHIPLHPGCGTPHAPGLSPLFVPRLWGRIFAPENMNGALHRPSRAEAPSSAANELLRLLSSRGVDK